MSTEDQASKVERLSDEIMALLKRDARTCGWSRLDFYICISALIDVISRLIVSRGCDLRIFPVLVSEHITKVSEVRSDLGQPDELSVGLH